MNIRINETYLLPIIRSFQNNLRSRYSSIFLLRHIGNENVTIIKLKIHFWFVKLKFCIFSHPWFSGSALPPRMPPLFACEIYCRFKLFRTSNRYSILLKSFSLFIDINMHLLNHLFTSFLSYTMWKIFKNFF